MPDTPSVLVAIALLVSPFLLGVWGIVPSIVAGQVNFIIEGVQIQVIPVWSKPDVHGHVNSRLFNRFRRRKGWQNKETEQQNCGDQFY